MGLGVCVPLAGPLGSKLDLPYLGVKVSLSVVVVGCCWGWVLDHELLGSSVGTDRYAAATVCVANLEGRGNLDRL